MRISDWSSDVCSSDLAGAVIEFLQAFLAPAQVVTFFARGIKQVTAGVRIARGQRLAVVQRLRGNLAGMIAAPPAGDVAALVGSPVGIGRYGGWMGTAGPVAAFGEQGDRGRGYERGRAGWSCRAPWVGETL